MLAHRLRAVNERVGGIDSGDARTYVLISTVMQARAPMLSPSYLAVASAQFVLASDRTAV